MLLPAEGPEDVSFIDTGATPLEVFGLKVQEVLGEILELSGLGMTVEILENESEILVDLQSGPYQDAMVARDYELLLAIEHLVEKIAVGDTDEDVEIKKVRLDSEGFRVKADLDLIQAAKSLAERVISEQRTLKIGPLDPRSRRVVHLALQDLPGVDTKSEGEGVFRRVCINPVSPESDDDDFSDDD